MNQTICQRSCTNIYHSNTCECRKTSTKSKILSIPRMAHTHTQRTCVPAHTSNFTIQHYFNISSGNQVLSHQLCQTEFEARTNIKSSGFKSQASTCSIYLDYVWGQLTRRPLLVLQHWKQASPNRLQACYPCYPYTPRAQEQFVEGMMGGRREVALNQRRGGRRPSETAHVRNETKAKEQEQERDRDEWWTKTLGPLCVTLQTFSQGDHKEPKWRFLGRRDARQTEAGSKTLSATS